MADETYVIFEAIFQPAMLWEGNEPRAETRVTANDVLLAL